MLKHQIFRLTFATLILLVSLLYGLPHIYLAHKLGNNYSPLLVNRFSSTGTDEITLYAPAVNYILQGHVFLQDAYVAEYARYPTPFVGESVPSIVMAILAKITGTIGSAFIAADFIFPAITFLLLYVFSSQFIKNGYFTLITAFTASVSRDFIATIPNPFSMIDYFKYGESQNEFLYLSRSFHPQVSFVFFLACITLLVNLIKKPSLLTSIILGISFGLLFYTYIFYWTYLLAFITIVLFYFTLRKNFQMVKLLVIAILIGLSIGFNYFQNVFDFYSLAIASDFTEKFTVSNAPITLTLFRYLIIAFLLWFVTSIKIRKNIFFKKELINFYLMLILIGIFFPIASKLIGKDLETLHYIRRALMPFATIAFFIMIYLFLKKTKFVLNSIAILVFIIFLTFGISIQIKAIEKIKISQTNDKELLAIFNWFNSNTPKNSVVGSIDTDFNFFIPTYTKNKVFFPPTDRSITPTNEEVERYGILSNLLGISPSAQRKDIDNDVSYIFSFQSYNQQKHKFELDPERRLLTESQLDILSRTDLTSLIKKYRIDYIVITPDEIKNINPHFELLTPLTSINGYVIFKVV